MDKRTVSIISRSNFDNALSAIQEFAHDLEKNKPLSEVPQKEKILWIPVKYKVNTDDINTVITGVNENMEAINGLKIRITDFATKLCDTLNCLDSEYLNGIKGSIEQTKFVSDQAIKSFKTIKKTVYILEQFKENLNKVKHLKDVDKLWDSNNANFKKIKAIEDKISMIQQSLVGHTETLIKLNKNINYLENKQVDFIDGYNKKITEQQELIEQILEENKLKIAEGINSFEKIFIEKQKKFDHQFSAFSNEQKEKFDSLNTKIKSEKEKLIEQSNFLHKKMKIAYVIACSSTAITIIHVILNVLGVV